MYKVKPYCDLDYVAGCATLKFIGCLEYIDHTVFVVAAIGNHGQFKKNLSEIDNNCGYSVVVNNIHNDWNVNFYATQMDTGIDGHQVYARFMWIIS